jgi:excisionase family DNA binding protein
MYSAPPKKLNGRASLRDNRIARFLHFRGGFFMSIQQIAPIAFSCDQVAALVQMSPTKIRMMVRRGEIKAVRFGSTWRIPKTEIERLCGKMEEVTK